MGTLGFEDYIEPLKLYLSMLDSVICIPNFQYFNLWVSLITDDIMFLFLYPLERIDLSDTKGSAKGHESSLGRDGLQSDYDQNA
ncbi:hypothetical protein LXL04_006222 [Taraxacum kok-saghyz]